MWPIIEFNLIIRLCFCLYSYSSWQKLNLVCCLYSHIFYKPPSLKSNLEYRCIWIYFFPVELLPVIPVASQLFDKKAKTINAWISSLKLISTEDNWFVIILNYKLHLYKELIFLLELVGMCKDWIWVLFNPTQSPQLEKSLT